MSWPFQNKNISAYFCYQKNQKKSFLFTNFPLNMTHYIYNKTQPNSTLLLTLSSDKQSSSSPCVLLSSFSSRLWDRSRVRSDTKPATCRVTHFTTLLPESASKLYRPRDCRLSAKLLPTLDRGCHAVSVTDPYGRILGFLDQSRYFFFQVAPQLYSRGWVDSVPDPLLLRKSGSARNWTRTSGFVARNSDH
jgi:hypothetical protein